MMGYEKLDAWKGCHALVLTTLKTIDGLERRDSDLLDRLSRTALTAAGKIAFGSGSRNRKMLLWGVQRAAGALSEFAYHLSIANVMGVLPEATCKRLGALRGRAAFYTWQLLRTLIAPPGGEHTPAG